MDMYDARRQPAHASPKPLVWGFTEAVRLGEGRNFEDVRTRNGRKGVRALLKLTGSCCTGAKNVRREFKKNYL